MTGPEVPSDQKSGNQACQLVLRKWERTLRLKSGIDIVRLLRFCHLPLIIFLAILICEAYLFRCAVIISKAASHHAAVANSTTATPNSDIDTARAFHPLSDSSLERTHTNSDSVQDSTGNVTHGNSDAVEESRKNFTEKRYKSIFFLKTHKTGSSTMSELLIPYARRHNLTIFYGPGSHLFRTLNSGDALYDAILANHFLFDWSIVNSFLRQPADLVITSLRLPLQRQLSWFRQQNREIDDVTCAPHDTRTNRNISIILDKFDAFSKSPNPLGSQFDALRERSVPYNGLNELGIINQFTFVVLRERFVDSLECLCSEVGVRLCDQNRNGKIFKSKNVSKKSTCVEAILLKYRSNVLIRGAARDIIMYEVVNDKLNKCMQNIPEACKCPR